MSDSFINKVKETLLTGDIKINGDRPWDIRIYNPHFYNRVVAQGSLGLGESYMDGWWDVKELDQFFYRLLQLDLSKIPRLNLAMAGLWIRSNLLNMQTKSRSTKVAKEHYDLSNNFYQKMLDKRMLYTCAYWKDASNLDQAQEDKLELICKKIRLKKHDKVLDLGCGFGGFAKYAAEKYGCEVTAFNISEQQIAYGQNSCKNLPVEFIKKDYREATGLFDKVVAIGLTEHVGYKNYKSLMNTAYRCLKNSGLFLLHTIGGDVSVKASDPWFDKYIFPHGMLPSVQQLAKASEKLFVIEDWHNFGPDYYKTLVAWYRNFDKNWRYISKNLHSHHPENQAHFDERFYRMWKYYLLSFAGSFRARKSQLWQAVFSKGGVPGGYESVR